MNVDRLHGLAVTWREEAEHLRHRGLEREAKMAESYASDLEATLREWSLEALTLEEAAEESGFSYSSLQQRLASGELPQAGSKGSPRIRRCDLPAKGGTGPRLKGQGPDLAERILGRAS